MDRHLAHFLRAGVSGPPDMSDVKLLVVGFLVGLDAALQEFDGLPRTAASRYFEFLPALFVCRR